VPNFALDILVNVVRTKIPLNSISFSSRLDFCLVLVLLTIIQNVFVFSSSFPSSLTKNTGSRQQTLPICFAGNGGYWTSLWGLTRSPEGTAFVATFMNFITSAIGIIHYGRFRSGPIHLNRPRSDSHPIIIRSLEKDNKNGPLIGSDDDDDSDNKAHNW